jgi:alpha-beta hydrolase superfamily lysophospholipase
MQTVQLTRRLTLTGTAAAMTGAIAHGASAATEGIWSGEYWATKQRNGNDIRLAMYRRRLGAPQSGETPRPVLFLVHGSSMSARSSFDLAVPGGGEYSSMNVFAEYGFDVWTMDHEGYGRSSRTDGNSDIASGVEDLKAAVGVVAQETGQTRCHFVGESSGALRAAAFAVTAPDRVGRLVLAAHTYTGKGSPTLGKRAEQVEYYRTHNTRPRDRAMIESIFTRDKAGTTDPEVPKALADAELIYGDTVPTGTYLDMTAHLPVVDPTKLASPVAVIRGEFDGIATMEDLWDFYRQLPSGDKQFSVIAGAAHALATSRNRQAFWHVTQAFLTMPAPPAS